MPIYDFRHDMTETRVDLPARVSEDAAPGRDLSLYPLEQSLDQTSPEYIKEHMIKGFHALDEATKTYWSDIRVPTQDNYRLLQVKIAGGNRSIQMWAEELADGRAKLPVASVSRGGWDHDPSRFGPAVLPMRIEYLNRDRTQAMKVFRPTPLIVDYEMSVWSEHKADAEYIMYQVMTRFNSQVAEFRMSDTVLTGNILLHFKGATDTSLKEAGPDNNAKTCYDYRWQAQAWLPLPSLVLPTVLGRVTVWNGVEPTIVDGSIP